MQSGQAAAGIIFQSLAQTKDTTKKQAEGVPMSNVKDKFIRERNSEEGFELREEAKNHKVERTNRKAKEARGTELERTGRNRYRYRLRKNGAGTKRDLEWKNRKQIRRPEKTGREQ